MLAAPYPTGGKNEKEEIASLVIAGGRLSLRRMQRFVAWGTIYRASEEP